MPFWVGQAAALVRALLAVQLGKPLAAEAQPALFSIDGALSHSERGGL
jgi:hypothetical protein